MFLGFNDGVRWLILLFGSIYDFFCLG